MKSVDEHTYQTYRTYMTVALKLLHSWKENYIPSINYVCKKNNTQPINLFLLPNVR